MKKILFPLVITVCFYWSKSRCDDIKVDLHSYWPDDKTRNVYKQYTTLSDDETKIKIKHIGEEIGFFVIQVHSYIANVTLSPNSSLFLHYYVTGTNIGLVYNNDGSSSTNFYLFRNTQAQTDKEVPILLIIMLYDSLAPIPGGCNLSFNNNIAPYQIVSYNYDYIEVESQPPSALGTSCPEDKIEVDMYHLFLKEYDNTDQTYFDGIEKMLTAESIMFHGRKVRADSGYYKYRRIYSSYRGTGEVFAVVATYNNRSTAYVSSVSYGCDLSNWEQCIEPVTGYWRLICAPLLILGLIICFFGHRIFRFTLFVIGFTFGLLLTYLAISFDSHFAQDEKLITSVVTGFFYGVIWVFIWWKFGIPFLSVHLNFILGGLLIASVVFYSGLADLHPFTNNINYWITFAALMIICLIIWIPSAMHFHIFTCSLLGAYACVMALSYYWGGHLQYIIINTFRRAVVNDFNVAIISPPFQIADILHCLLWAFLITVGCYIQLRHQWGKPPFPANRRGVLLANSVSERTPLIRSESVAVPQYV